MYYAFEYPENAVESEVELTWTLLAINETVGAFFFQSWEELPPALIADTLLHEFGLPDGKFRVYKAIPKE